MLLYAVPLLLLEPATSSLLTYGDGFDALRTDRCRSPLAGSNKNGFGGYRPRNGTVRTSVLERTDRPLESPAEVLPDRRPQRQSQAADDRQDDEHREIAP